MAASHHIGTSGWSYADWGKGRFYPKGLKQGEWLAYYARTFGTVEVNMSFYRIPPHDLLDHWVAAVGPDFRFGLKLWRGITHLKRLAGTGESLRRYFEVVERLGDRRGPLLVQLPPSLGYDLELLDGFLTDLDAETSLTWRVGVEFRSSEWLRSETYELLDRRGLALCLADHSRCTITEPNNVDFVYMRRHGSNRHREGRYTDDQIAADADLVRGWLAQHRDVYVYYNNDAHGHAVDNARQLSEQLGSTKAE